MANLKDVRRRIASVKNTQQITKAMKMIAAVKLRKAQDQILANRPYARELITVISNLAHYASSSHHPLLAQKRAQRRVHLVVVTSNRGLCGSYNGSIIRSAEKFIGEMGQTVEACKVSFIGRRGYDYFKSRIKSEWIGNFYKDISAERSYEHAVKVANESMEQFMKGGLDHIYFIYNEFKSAISQKVVVETLLPVTPVKTAPEMNKIDYLYEPSRDGILKALLPKHVRVQVFRILLEAVAAEHGARMTAMDSATTNAGEMIGGLTLKANRLRQSAITTELMEIVSGAEALKG